MRQGPQVGAYSAFTTTTAAIPPWATIPQLATLPPAPTDEQLSPAAVQFSRSGHIRDAVLLWSALRRVSGMRSRTCPMPSGSVAG